MTRLFFRSELVGEIQDVEADPPFFSGYFIPAEQRTAEGEAAYQYLLFCTKEFELKEGSTAYLQYEKEKESLYPFFIFSDEWRIGEELLNSAHIENPLLSAEGLLFWSDTI